MDAATLDRTDLNPRVARLIDKDDCRELVHKFARAIDRCDAGLIGEILHPDATDDHGSFKGTGKDFVPWVMGVLGGMRRTQHVVGNILIELDGDTAYGESYFIAHHALPGKDDAGDTFMVAAGRYLDRFERRDGAWRIAHRGAVYDWSSAVASTDMWDRDALPGYAFGQRGERDPSYRHFAGGAWQD